MTRIQDGSYRKKPNALVEKTVKKRLTPSFLLLKLILQSKMAFLTNFVLSEKVGHSNDEINSSYWRWKGIAMLIHRFAWCVCYLLSKMSKITAFVLWEDDIGFRAVYVSPDLLADNREPLREAKGKDSLAEIFLCCHLLKMKGASCLVVCSFLT